MASIYFKSPEHRQRLLVALEQTGAVYDGNKVDQEYSAALYILTADLGIWQRVQEYVGHSRIDIPEMLENIDLSSGYKTLVELAGNLFNSQTHTEPIELMGLDESNFRLALTALQIRRVRLRVEDFKE